MANSYRPNSEYNNYTRIEGAFAKHLSTFVDLAQMPAASIASGTAPSHVVPEYSLGPWEAMQIQEDME